MATTISSGQIDINYINQFFKKGLNLNAYRSTPYFIPGNASLTPTGTFPSGAISFSSFYNTSNTSGAVCVIFLTSGSSWTVPSDWNDADNSVVCIGGGSGGKYQQSGGGGAYSASSNLDLTPGAIITYAIGAGGGATTTGTQSSGGDTCFGGSTIGSASTSVGAQGGRQATGGAAGSGKGTTRYSGGSSVASGRGGGGAAGSGGNGVSPGGATGGAGGGGSWTSNPGGSVAVPGAGGNYSSSNPAPNGGLYGGGGGGSSFYQAGTAGTKKSPGTPAVYGSGGVGQQGIIVISYRPTL